MVFVSFFAYLPNIKPTAIEEFHLKPTERKNKKKTKTMCIQMIQMVSNLKKP